MSTGVRRLPYSDLRRFWRHTVWGPLAKNGDRYGRCILWQGGKDSGGYGTFSFKGKTVSTHRWIWETLVGSTYGLPLDHFACETTNCVNVFHLRPTSIRENAIRNDSAGALNLAKTHCPYGHEYTEENTYYRPRTGRRECRICMRARGRRAYDKRTKRVNG